MIVPAHNNMQVPTLVLIVAIEIYLALLIATFALLYFSFKQKKLIKRQQHKLTELIDTVKNIQSPELPPSATYKQFIYEQLDITQERFNFLAPRSDISGIQPLDVPLNQRIVALRYAFLRAEELGTTAVQGSEGYWDIFKQTLEPLLQSTQENSSADSSELETYKKRVENLEKFKKLFFDLEKRWNEAQANAQGYYNELYAMADSVADRERYEALLGRYNDSYNDINHYIHSTSNAINGASQENKTINIIRQDPRAAEEIMKLRNVAADQYRVISNLQRKLEDAVTAEEKDLVIKELEQQLQRQVRFVQESDTCVQLLEEELNKANEKIAEQEQQLDSDHDLEEENQRIKQTLEDFTQESKELLENIEELEKENDELKHSLDESVPTTNGASNNMETIQTEFAELRKQYAELEEKYLELKFK
ncbi:MAG: hypothetical protein B0W54_08355 [Cellvibrio sp. 79]|nr:MAG: hypothetical protein B0W54_08355 [Cellvibrio sp. 79]